LGPTGGAGAWGESDNGYGVAGATTNGLAGIFGHGGRNGVWGYTASKTDSGVFGSNDGDGGNGVAGYSKNGVGVLGWSDTGLAALFNGNVTINGTLTMGNQGDVLLADFAEDFDVADAAIEPGTVVVIDQNGALQQCNLPYDRRVVGVISGAGNFRPGIVLGKKSSEASRGAVALVGKVYCKVDADYAPVEIGDLLTTSPTLGNAMKVTDPLSALGSVIGKALCGLQQGKGLIPILVALQ
jgi:hypothetical protein